MKLSLILAADERGIIACRGKIPWLWEIPSDMERFMEITKEAGFIIMGRKTWEDSLHCHPLPKRDCIVVTRDRSYTGARCFIVHSPEEAMRTASLEGAKAAVVIGGRELAEVFLKIPELDTVYLTRVHTWSCADERDGNLVFLPDLTGWEPVKMVAHIPRSNRDKYGLTFLTLQRVARKT